MSAGTIRSRAPIGLIGAIALVSAIEGGRREPTIEGSSKPALAWRFADESSRSAPSAIGAEVLCLGDSLVKLGVQPKVIASRLGRTSYNLAIPGAQAMADVVLLRRAIADGAVPSVVVVDFDENLLAVSPRENLEGWAELLGPVDCLGFARHVGDPDLAARVASAMLLPTLRDRSAIREHIVARLGGSERPILPELRGLVRNWRRNDGAQFVPPGERGPDLATAPDADRPLRAWRPHPFHSASVRRFCALADRHGIAVVWLLPPIRPDWRDRRAALGLLGTFDRFVAEIRAEFPSVSVVDGRDAGFPAEVFRDATHLDGTGAVALSEALAEAIEPLFEGERPPPALVRLRPFEAPSTPIEFEDTDRSRIVAADRASRRTR